MPPERTFRRRKGLLSMSSYSTNGKAKTPSQRERVLSRLKQGSVTSWELDIGLQHAHYGASQGGA